MKKVTIKDIALIAGVSRGTVDRVINGRGKVSGDVEKKIIKIAGDIGFEKNLFASSLASNKKYKIAIVSPDPASDIFWALPRGGIVSVLDLFRHYGITTEYFDFNVFRKEDYCIQMENALASRPDAILTAPTFTHESMEYLDQALKLNIPVITFNTEINHPAIISYTGQHSYNSGYLAGRLLHLRLQPGDEIIAFNLGHELSNAQHYTDKINGLKAYVNDHALCDNPVFCYESDQFEDSNKLQLFFERVQSAHPKMKGLFFTNSRAYMLIDVMSEEFIKKCNIIGFDMVGPNIKLLKEDKLDFIINQNPVRQGYMSMMNFVNHFILKKEFKNTQYLPLDIVIKENVEFYTDFANGSILE